MKELVCYLFDRSERGASAASVMQPIVGTPHGEWAYLIGFHNQPGSCLKGAFQIL